MRRIYDYECTDKNCGLIFEWFAEFDEEVFCPICWNSIAKRIMPQGKAPGFKLKYNPQTDMVDWSGNRSQYWDQWKSLPPDERKKQRIPKHDGDG